LRYWLCPSLLSAHLYGGERLSLYTYWVSCRLSLYYGTMPKSAEERK